MTITIRDDDGGEEAVTGRLAGIIRELLRKQSQLGCIVKGSIRIDLFHFYRITYILDSHHQRPASENIAAALRYCKKGGDVD